MAMQQLDIRLFAVTMVGGEKRWAYSVEVDNQPQGYGGEGDEATLDAAYKTALHYVENSINLKEQAP